MKTLLTMPGCGIDVIDNEDAGSPLAPFGSYAFLSKYNIDGDGKGPSYGDPDYQNTTTYKPDLNSSLVPYFVLPPQVRAAVRGICIGCRGTVGDRATGRYAEFVVGDIGPHTKIGEGSIYGAKLLGVPWSPTTGGCSDIVFQFIFYPGVPAVIDGVTYRLQAAALAA